MILVDAKYMFGRLLGETYRLQRRIESKMCGVGDDVIYGLLNGIETVVDDELNSAVVTREEVRVVSSILNEYWINPAKVQSFRGYYDIEPRLEEAGIERWKAIRILSYFRIRGQFASLIDKMDSEYSPSECRTFEIDAWYR